ncbi:hypothetical protein ACFVYA_10805 [Amycolatopsis sp. NPDC058278]|uniref:hypothetical protein n=1 Tax=Amycolatopsis sp. NPDC058278 TaxID=3346417 RepID=UPI0036DA9025
MNRDQFTATSLKVVSTLSAKARVAAASSAVYLLASGRAAQGAAASAVAPLLKELSDHTLKAARKYSARAARSARRSQVEPLRRQADAGATSNPPRSERKQRSPEQPRRRDRR